LHRAIPLGAPYGVCEALVEVSGLIDSALVMTGHVHDAGTLTLTCAKSMRDFNLTLTNAYKPQMELDYILQWRPMLMCSRRLCAMAPLQTRGVEITLLSQ
jgi:hypothetical protein